MRIQVITAVAIALIAGSQAAFAAAPTPQIDQSVTPPAQTRVPLPGPVATTTVPAQGPTLFHLFGLPVRLSAPVAPPYSNGAYTTFAGQPATGQDVILLQNAPN